MATNHTRSLHSIPPQRHDVDVGLYRAGRRAKHGRRRSDPWLSPDETTIYFARGTDIFSATR